MFPADSVFTTEENSVHTTKVPLNISVAPAGQSSDHGSSDLPAVSCTAFVFSIRF